MTKSSGSQVPELSRGDPEQLKHNTDSSPDIHRHRKNSPDSGDLRDTEKKLVSNPATQWVYVRV